METNISEIAVPVTDRNLPYYLEAFGLKAEELRGKTILNLGSGKSNLGRELDKQGINAHVIDLDRAYKKGRKGIPAVLLAADMGKIPLKDGSVEIVFASWSLFPWATRFGKKADPYFEEIIRVLKPGGTALFYPVGLFGSKSKGTNSIGKVLEKLERNLPVKVTKFASHPEQDLKEGMAICGLMSTLGLGLLQMKNPAALAGGAILFTFGWASLMDTFFRLTVKIEKLK